MIMWKLFKNEHTSLDWSSDTDGAGDITYDDPKLNPNFYDYNHVYLRYCTGEKEKKILKIDYLHNSPWKDTIFNN